MSWPRTQGSAYSPTCPLVQGRVLAGPSHVSWTAACGKQSGQPTCWPVVWSPGLRGPSAPPPIPRARVLPHDGPGGSGNMREHGASHTPCPLSAHPALSAL